MLRRHFMTGTELPDFIITYYAPEHIPFWCGIKKKDINSILNYGRGVLEDGVDGFKTPIIFDIVLDKWEDGVGKWGIKIKNTTQISYYSIIQEGSLDDPSSLKVGTFDYYADYFNTNMNYVNKITNIIFSKGLTHINGSPLYSANKNTSCLSITLPDSVEYLTGDLFGDYDSLKSITIPSNVKRIDNLCYVCDGNSGWSNSSLEEVILKPLTPPDTSYSQQNGPLGTYYEDKVYNNLKIRVYADCINTYKNDAVWGQYNDLYDTINNAVVCYAHSGEREIYERNGDINEIKEEDIIDKYSKIYLPNTTHFIRKNAFSGFNLTDISMPTVTVIEEYAFSRTKLRTINIQHVREIGNRAFEYCSSLISIVIGNGVTNIGEAAFRDCSSLTSITFDGTKNQWEKIELDRWWNENVPATVVHCIDGDVEL